MLGIGGAGVAIGASGKAAVRGLFKSMFNTPEDPEKDAHEFYGKVNQALPHPHKNMQLRWSVAIEMQLRYV